MQNNDTIVAFTPFQAKNIHLYKQYLDECRETQDTLQSKIARDSLFVEKLRFRYSLLEIQESQASSLVLEQDRQLEVLKIQLNTAVKKNKRNRLKIGILGGTVVVTGTVLAILAVSN